MGFLDEIKNKMHLGGQQGYDQGYGQVDDYGYDEIGRASCRERV